MHKFSGALFAATVSLALAALFADAQAAPKIPAKPSAPPASAAPAGPKR